MLERPEARVIPMVLSKDLWYNPVGNRAFMLTSLPNLLTLSRICVIPVILALLYLPNPLTRWVALALFAFAGLTDFLDGYLNYQRIGSAPARADITAPVVDTDRASSAFRGRHRSRRNGDDLSISSG